MRIVIFGIGLFYENNKHYFDDDELIAYIDNCVKSDDKVVKDDLIVYNPSHINELDPDYIVLMSNYAKEMRKQLLMLGVDENIILYFEQYLYNKYQNKHVLYKKMNIAKTKRKKSILFLTPDLCHTGAANAMVIAISVLSDKYNIDVAAAKVLLDDCERLIENTTNIIKYPAIYSIKWEENNWLSNYDYIICNTVYLLPTYLNLCRHINTILWLHDPNVINEYEKSIADTHNLTAFRKHKIYAVSEYAKNAFINNFTIDQNIELLPYGIEDNIRGKKAHQKIVFAIIGALYPIKGQDIFIKAIKELPKFERNKCVFLIVGKYSKNSGYFNDLLALSNGLDNIVFTGEKSSEEMSELYSEIDVVTCSSREDMLPTVIAEGMMNRLIVISSNTTGFTHYIKTGINGFVFDINNYLNLTNTMKYIIDNFDNLNDIRDNAYDTYSENFSKKCFRNNLIDILEE